MRRGERKKVGANEDGRGRKGRMHGKERGGGRREKRGRARRANETKREGEVVERGNSKKMKKRK